jgi:hypothetical protein
MTDSVEDARPRILFVDDEPDLLAPMGSDIREWSFRISTAPWPSSAIGVITPALTPQALVLFTSRGLPIKSATCGPAWQTSRSISTSSSAWYGFRM